MAGSVPSPSPYPTQRAPPSASDSAHSPKNQVEAATNNGEDKTPQFDDGLDHLDSTQYIERFKKYDAEYTRRLTAKYFSAKTLNGVNMDQRFAKRVASFQAKKENATQMSGQAAEPAPVEKGTKRSRPTSSILVPPPREEDATKSIPVPEMNPGGETCPADVPTAEVPPGPILVEDEEDDDQETLAQLKRRKESGKAPAPEVPVEDPSVAEGEAGAFERRVVRDSKLFKGYVLPVLHFSDPDYFKTLDKKLFQECIHNVMAWQSIGLGLLEDLHDQSHSFTQAQAVSEENESLKSRIADLEKDDANLRKWVEEMENNSAVTISQLEADKAELIKKLEEAEKNVASFQENARKSEAKHFEVLAKLGAEKTEVTKECTEIRSQKKASDQKCHELVLANTKLRQDLDFQVKQAAELTQDVKEMSEEFELVVYDAFCNCVKQIQAVNPGINFNLKGISPEYAFNSSGKLVYIASGEAVDLDTSPLTVFDPDRTFAEFQGKDEGVTKQEGGGETSGHAP